MKAIAVFSHFYAPEVGAPSARIGDFGALWRREGKDVHVVTCFPNYPTGKIHAGYRSLAYDAEILNGITVHRNWTYVTPNNGIFRRSFGHLTFWLSARINTLHRLPPISCTIGTSPTFFAAMAARDCARRQRVPFIMEVRDLWPAVFRDLGVIRNRLLLAILERWEMALYRSAAHVVTVTDAFRENLIARGVPAEKITTITNGADTEYWTVQNADPVSLRKSLGLENKFVVLYCGAHGVSQGLSSHVRAANRLRDDDTIRFVFVGDGADKARIENEARSLGLRNVQFHCSTSQERVRDYYAMADVCMVPLRGIPLFDGFIPSKMFEIMSMSRPIVASLRGEAARILESSGAAVIVPPEDETAIARAVTALRSSQAQLVRMGAAGRVFVANFYSRDKLAKRYLEVIDRAEADFIDKRRGIGST